MNSYPIELLVQHAPLMFVAGLEVPPAKQDPFHSLVVRLREILSARPKGLVWDKNRGSAFNILLVDKNIRFPPRKVVPTGDQGQNAPHSPLSPLVPSSPLYPDGLIAPVWVRKHVELVPSIFVVFLRLWESPPPLSPLEGRREQEVEEERFHDQELATELSTRKRALAERGIKLTAVLLASRRLLDDPGLDARLTFLRRQSALDARAALFVLSPVNNNELQEFIHSLTEALREPSVEYYTAHSKRVRRKRNRHAGSAYSGYPTSALATTRAVPLRPIGWTVRYEYKMGTFAEFRFEEEVARKHYEDCWNALSEMFNSVTMLPPRTKRWAEAKVLADSVAIKIYKLYLYNNEHSLALSYFNRHVKRFCELSKSWGIGEDTFEYWSWIARQYRILAEILEIALRAGLRLPILLPQPPVERPPQQLTLEPPPVPGIAPANALQHPGYYYFQAARYTQERLRRFKLIEDAEILKPTNISQSPAFNNEKKTEHWEVILELYSKAYEQFKRHSAGQSRLTFFVAVQIATAYHASAKHDLAFKFFERIVKVYHKERWTPMMKPILGMWYESSKQIGNIETCIKLLFERMSSLSQEEEAATVSDDLMAILRTTKPGPESSSLIVDLSPSEQILHTAVTFYEEYSFVGKPTPFQLRISSPPFTCLHLLPVKHLAISFSDDRSPIIINKVAESTADSVVFLGNLGNSESQATQVDGSLDFMPGTTQVISGTITSEAAMELKITRLTLRLLEADWTIDVNFDPTVDANLEPLWRSQVGGVWKDIPIQKADPSSVAFRPSSHNFKVDISHESNALVGEDYPVLVPVHNHDTRSLSITMDVLLQPAENETVNFISIGEERSTSFVKGISFEVIEPGSSADRTIILTSGGTGKRILDLSIQSRVSGLATGGTAAEEIETLRTVSVNTLEPFQHDSYVTYSQSHQSLPDFLNVATFDSWDGYNAEAMVVTTLECVADCELEIASVTFIDTGSAQSKLLSSSLPLTQGGPLKCMPGDSFCVEARVGVGLNSADPIPSTAEVYSSPVRVGLEWRRAGSNASFTTTTLSLPELKPPVFGLTVFIEPPASTKLHTSFTLDVRVRNNDPHRSADLNYVLEPAEGFVIAGFRAGTLPLLLPGTEESLSFNLIPINAGHIKLPVFKIQQILKEEPVSDPEAAGRTGAIVDIIPVVDKRWDSLDALGNNVHFYSSDGTTLAELDLSLWLSVLVLAR